MMRESKFVKTRFYVVIFGLLLGLFCWKKSLSAMESFDGVETACFMDPDGVLSFAPMLGLVPYDVTASTPMAPSFTPMAPTPMSSTSISPTWLCHSPKRPSPLRISLTAADIEREEAEQERLEQARLEEAANRPYYSDTPNHILCCLIRANKWFSISECGFLCHWPSCKVGHALSSLEEVVEHLFVEHLKLPSRLPEFRAKYLSKFQ